jgi:hypothetical protein
MGTGTWNFTFPQDDMLEQERELIDLPEDFYISVKYTGAPKPPITPIVKMMLERLNEPKKEEHQLWTDDPPYFGYAKKVTIKITRRPDMDNRQAVGTVQIIFQPGSF